MKKQKVLLQMKGQDKTPEEQLNEVASLPEKEFRMIIVNMIQDLGKQIGEKLSRCKKSLPKN